MLKKVTLSPEYRTTNDVLELDGYGPLLVYSEMSSPGAESGQQIWLVDLEAETVRALNEPEDGYSAITPRISGTDIVWTMNDLRRDGSIDWRVVHHDLAADTSQVVAEGRNTRLEEGSANTPAVDVDNGLIAYAVEAGTRQNPFAWRIIIQDLATGSVVREVTTSGSLWGLALDDGNLIYTDVEPDASGTLAGVVQVSLADDPEPLAVARDGFEVDLDGDRFVWTAWPPADEDAPTTGRSVFTATMTDLAPVTLSRPLEVRFGGRAPAIGDGMVSWNESEEEFDNLIVWDAAHDRTFQVVGEQNEFTVFTQQDFLSSIAGGWLAWSVIVNDHRARTTIPTFSGLPVYELRTFLGLD
jgi:hypothetical protein